MVELAAKYGVSAFISIYVIQQLFKLVMFMAKTKKPDSESDLKERSRTFIEDTNKTLNDIKPAFWKINGQCDTIHDVVTQKDSGIPLIYNKALEKEIINLNNNIVNLTTAIATLGENCKKRS